MDEDDVFASIEIEEDEVDRELDKERDETTFDIDMEADEKRKEAYDFVSTMYKRHFYVLFIASIVSVVNLITMFTIVSSVTWASTNQRVIAFNSGIIAFSIANIILMPLIEKTIYVQDDWTLTRLGIHGFSSNHALKSLVAGAFPLVFLLVPLLSGQGFVVVGNLMINPLAWFLFFIGMIPTSIFEEIVFRGIYWKYMLMKYGRKGSLALVHGLNGLLFAGIHLPRIFFEYVDTLYAGELPFMGLSILFNGLIFVLNGFILSLLRDTFKNLIAPIVYHIVLNILVVTIQFNRFYMLLFTFLLLVITLAINLLRPINPSEPPQEKVAPRYKENVLNTPEHEWFRLAYYGGNGLIVLFALFMISTGDLPDMIISAVVAIPALLAVGYVYGKRLWLFSYL